MLLHHSYEDWSRNIGMRYLWGGEGMAWHRAQGLSVSFTEH